jgi:hypothetical protein
MSVQVDRRLLARWRQGYSSIGIVVDFGPPVENPLDVVRQVVSDAASPLAILRAVRFSSGAVGVWVAGCEPDDFEHVLGGLGESLARHEYADATLKMMPIVKPLWGKDGLGYLMCSLGLRGIPDPNWASNPTPRFGPPIFDVDAADREAAVAALCDWATDLDGADPLAVVTAGSSVYTKLDLADAREAMTDLISAGTVHHSGSMIVTAGERFRQVDLSLGMGVAAVAAGHKHESSFEWRPALDEMVELLTKVGGWCSYANVTRGSLLGALMAFRPQHGSLDRTTAWRQDPRLVRLVETRDELFDVFGVMRLRAELAAKLPFDEHDWSLTEPRPDVVLALHRQPEAWFSSHAIDRRTLAMMRQRFEPFISEADAPDRDI